MYLTENYICFYSSVLGISKKLIVPLNDVTKITKAKRLGIIKSLMIYHSTVKTPYKFQSFHDVDQTFKIVQKLWSNVSPYAADSNNAISSEEDNDANADDSMLDGRPSVMRVSERMTELAGVQNAAIVEERKENANQGEASAAGVVDTRETVSNAVEEIKKQESSVQQPVPTGEASDVVPSLKQPPLENGMPVPVEKAQGI